MSHIYCPECGFQNPEAANYCSKCGALLVKDEPGSETTMSYTPEEGEERALVTLEELGTEGPALVVRSGGGRAGEHFVPQGERTTIGRSPDCDIFLDDVTVSRKHAVLVAARRRLRDRGPGEPQRHVPQPPADRVREARERRRAPDRQVQADLPGELSMSAAQAPSERAAAADDRQPSAAACRREFPDISISKIRYLEDQGLLAPRRTQSGYRLFSEDDVERLETILRLQRDEFLPLRVIRQELASPSGPGKERRRRRAAGLAGGGGRARPRRALRAGGDHARAGARARGVRPAPLAPRGRARSSIRPTDVDIAVACAKLSRYGISRAAPAHVPDGGRPRGRPARTSSSRRRCARATRSAGRPASRSSRRWPSSRRSSRSCSSGAISVTVAAG